MRHGWTKRIPAIALALSTLVGGGAVLPFAVSAGQVDTSGVQSMAADAAVQVALSDLLEAVLDEEISDAEAAWLDNDSNHPTIQSLGDSVKLTYQSSLPASLLSYDVHEESEGGVTLRLSVHEADGRIWIPVSVRIDEIEYTPVRAGDVYEIDLPDAALGEDLFLVASVTYQTEFVLKSDHCKALANAAYNAVKAAKAKQAQYEADMAVYQDELAVYNAYLEKRNQYLSDLQKHNAYLKAYEQYKKDWTAYEAYLADMETYLDEKAVYDAYLAEYNAYLELLKQSEELDRKYQAYVKWQNDMALVKSQLGIVQSCFVPDPTQHRLFGTLRGDTVETVVSRQDELVSAGCSAQDIANADAATKALVLWLESYEPFKTEQDEYNYYAKNYPALRDNVKLLYVSLARLYTNPIVPEILMIQGKTERYHQFVSQLYILWCALDDSVMPDPNWTIGNKTLEEALVFDTFLLTDTNKATPLTGYPAVVEPVTPPSELKPPAVVPCPTEPDKVAEPTEPTYVAKPNPPATVKRPTEPQAPVFSTYLLALMESDHAAVTNGRVLTDENRVYTASLQREWVVRTTDDLVVNFYNADGSKLLNSITVPQDEAFSLPDEAFVRQMDVIPSDTDRYTYMGTGWKDEDGTAFGYGTALTVDGDLPFSVDEQGIAQFYATYQREVRCYDVTWVIGDREMTESVPYGTMPDYGGSDADRIKWTPAVSEVTGDVTYVGEYRYYEITWIWMEDGEEKAHEDECNMGETPQFPMDVPSYEDGRYVYEFAGWSPDATVAPTGDTTYRAFYRMIDRIPGLPEDAEVLITIGDKGNREIGGSGWFDGGSYRIDLTTLSAWAAQDGRALVLSSGGVMLRLTPEALQAAAALSDAELTVKWDAINKTFSFDVKADGVLADGFSAEVSDDGKTWKPVTAATLYDLNEHGLKLDQSVENGYVHFGDRLTAITGEIVEILWTAQPGYRLAELTVNRPDGTLCEITAVDGGRLYTFVMPDDDVTVSARFERIMYTVSFYCNGELWSQKTYVYGEMIQLPDDPVDADGRPFVGWDPAVTAETPVTGDAVYEAVFFTRTEGDDATSTLPDRANGLNIIQLVAVFSCVWLGTCGGALTLFFVVRGLLRRRKPRTRA